MSHKTCGIIESLKDELKQGELRLKREQDYGKKLKLRIRELETKLTEKELKELQGAPAPHRQVAQAGGGERSDDDDDCVVTTVTRVDDPVASADLGGKKQKAKKAASSAAADTQMQQQQASAPLGGVGIRQRADANKSVRKSERSRAIERASAGDRDGGGGGGGGGGAGAGGERGGGGEEEGEGRKTREAADCSMLVSCIMGLSQDSWDRLRQEIAGGSPSLQQLIDIMASQCVRRVLFEPGVEASVGMNAQEVDEAIRKLGIYPLIYSLSHLDCP